MRLTMVVIVPTWKRPDHLKRCLDALLSQTVPPERILVAAKQGDIPTVDLMTDYQTHTSSSKVQLVLADASSNVVGQQNAALNQTVEDVVAITDDDAEPKPDWLERISAYYEDETVGGVGGRDWQPIERWDEPIVGKLQWFGRTIGNHHLGCGPPRDVEVLKGVNCSFRGDLLRRIGFSKAMRGRGTVINWELSLSFSVLRAGYRLIYDPAIIVDHNIAVRKDGDINQRGGFEPESYFDNVHNETLSLLEHLLPRRRLAYYFWSMLIGTRGNPGFLQSIRSLVTHREPINQVLRRHSVASRARKEGWQSWRKSFT